MAQLGARFHGMEEVIGSIPIRSTNKSTTCKLPPFQLGVIWCQTRQTPSDTLLRCMRFTLKPAGSIVITFRFPKTFF